MQRFGAESYGQDIYVDFGRDVSGATSYEATLTPELRYPSTHSAVLGATPVVVGDRTLPAGTYVTVTPAAGVLAEHRGRWMVWAVATYANSAVQSPPELFSVV
jgi:hypothetical protein